MTSKPTDGPNLRRARYFEVAAALFYAVAIVLWVFAPWEPLRPSAGLGIRHLGLFGGALLCAGSAIALRFAAPRPSPFSWGAAATVGTVVAFGSVVMNSVGAWPFVWRSPAHGSVGLVQDLVAKGSYQELLPWAIVSLVITPVLEELVFRGLLLEVLPRVVGSLRGTVVISSLLFGALHLPYPLSQAGARILLVNAAWLAVFSVPLAWSAAKTSDYRYAIVAHVVRNSTETAIMFVAIGLS